MQKNLTDLEGYLMAIDLLGYTITFPENEEKKVENITVHTDEGDLSLEKFLQDIHWVKEMKTVVALECIKLIKNLKDI